MNAAMTRLRIPRHIIVPIAVMTRFLPTQLQELKAIKDAVRLRGIFPHWYSILLHPMQLAECTVVPLLSSSMRIADDLTASALLRGFGTHPRPTTVEKLGFSFDDALMLICALLLMSLDFALGV